MSAHAAEARLLWAALAGPAFGAREIEVHSQLCRETEIVALLTRATLWQPDPLLAWLAWQWELAWLPQSPLGVAQGLTIDAAAFGYALHTAIRPAARLPEQAPLTDPFAAALRRIEAESSRVVQAQLRFLKSQDLAPARDAIAAQVDRRHQQMRRLWTEVLASLNVGDGS